MSPASIRRWSRPPRRWARVRRQRFDAFILPLLAPGLAITFCLSFVQAFSVFPSAVLLGAPAGPTRVISIAAYQAAFEQYDYSLASAIAMIMAGVQLLIVAALLGCARLVLSRPGERRQGLRSCTATLTANRLWASAVWALVGFFVLNLLAMIAHVVVTSSFATRWLGTWLPAGCTPQMVFARPGTSSSSTTSWWSLRGGLRGRALSGLIGVPAAYAMARREFPGQAGW